MVDGQTHKPFSRLQNLFVFNLFDFQCRWCRINRSAPCGFLWDQDRLLLFTSSSAQALLISVADTCGESQRPLMNHSFSASVFARHGNRGVSGARDGSLEKQPLQTAVQQQQKAKRTLYSLHRAALSESRLMARGSYRRP